MKAQAAGAHRFLSGFGFQGRELVYRDPPYMRSVRSGPRRHRLDFPAS